MTIVPAKSSFLGLQISPKITFWVDTFSKPLSQQTHNIIINSDSRMSRHYMLYRKEDILYYCLYA